jgi:hypothetical protein
MKELTKLENMVADWLKPIPHLPNNWRKWLAENVWWITLVGVILSVIGVLSMISAIFAAQSYLGATTSILGAANLAGYSGWWVVVSVISILFMIAVIAIMAVAINPLKLMQKRGWDLLFLTLVIGVLATVVNVFLGFNAFTFIPSIIFGFIGYAISAYFLYEIRSHFNSVHSTTHKK